MIRRRRSASTRSSPPRGAVGLLAGGVITQAINWHWIFLCQRPVGSLLLAICDCSPRQASASAKAQIFPAVLITSALISRVHDRQAGRRARWGREPHALLGAISIVLLAIFLAARRLPQSR